MSGQPSEERLFTVSEEEAGMRLDRFLTAHCADLSRTQIQRSLATGGAEVAGRPRPKGYRVDAGNRILFRPALRPEPRAVPQALPLTVIHEDRDIIVVDKPAGLVVHPAPGHPDGTLVNALLHHCQKLSPGGDPLRPGVVHRLDRDTSGLLVAALTSTAHRELAAQLKERRMRRTYLALSWGGWTVAEGVIQEPIARHPRNRIKMAVVEGGRAAETHYRVVEDFGFVQLCRVSLGTGRTHQIRVHFAFQSHPIVGDPLYGDDRRASNVRPVERPLATQMVKLARRQLLHAVELTLQHPRRGETLTFTAPLPADLDAVLTVLRHPA